MKNIIFFLLASVSWTSAQTVSMSGDVTGNNTATVVGQINGTTIPSANSTALGVVNGTAGSYVASDSNNNVGYDPHAMGLTNQIFAFIGCSRTGGATLSTPATQKYPYLFSQMAYAKNHGYAGSGTGYLANGVYDFSVGGAIIPAGYVQGGAGTPITPTTQIASWTGATNAVTLSGSNANIVAGMVVSGTNIPYGTKVGAISGTSLTLNPAIGQTTGTTATGTGVTLSFTGNGFGDQYNNFVHALRPSVTGCSRATLFIGDFINDVAGFGGTTETTPAGIVTNIHTIVAAAIADGFTVIVDTTAGCSQGTADNYSVNSETARVVINDLIRNGAAGVPSSQVHNVDYLWTSNTAIYNGVYQTPDGLHPNASAHILIGNDLNNFMTASGNGTGFGPHFMGRVFAETGFVSGPVNNGFLISDNLTLTINSSQSSGAYARASYINTGYGNALSSTGNEVDWMFGPSNSAGTYNQDMKLPFKLNLNGTFGFGGNGSTVSGTMTSNDFYNDTSHNIYAGAGNLSFATAGKGIVGGATATLPASTIVGEQQTNLVASGSATSLTTATPKNVCSVSLTAGHWFVTFNPNVSSNAATMIATSPLIAGISTTTATLPTDGTEGYQGVTITASGSQNSIPCSGKFINVTGTTTVYGVVQATFTAGTVSSFGSLQAMRLP